MLVLFLACIGPACVAAWIVFSLYGPAPRARSPGIASRFFPDARPLAAAPQVAIALEPLVEPPTVHAPPPLPPAPPIVQPVVHRPRFASQAMPPPLPRQRAPRGTPSPVRERPRTFEHEEATRVDP